MFCLLKINTVALQTDWGLLVLQAHFFLRGTLETFLAPSSHHPLAPVPPDLCASLGAPG